MKYIQRFLIILAVFCTVVDSVFASDIDIFVLDSVDIIAFGENTTVIVDNINFTILRGYGEQKITGVNRNGSEFNGEEVMMSVRQYVNDIGDLIDIQVIEDNYKNSALDNFALVEGCQKADINGIDCYCLKYDYVCMFGYCVDGKYVQITTIDDIIPEIIN